MILMESTQLIEYEFDGIHNIAITVMEHTKILSTKRSKKKKDLGTCAALHMQGRKVKGQCYFV
jgi:hypothetical protein